MTVSSKLIQAAAGFGGEPEGAWDLSYAYNDDPFLWDISTAKYVANKSVLSEENTPQAVFFKPDGTKMYITGNNGDDVNEYNLSTAWSVSTATYSQNFSVSSQETEPYGMFFKPDGTKMYILGNSGDDINEYDLSTAWDISTASYSQNFSVNAQETVPTGIHFKPDGTKMYIIGLSGDDVNEYNLSTAWDVSTASYLQNFSVATEDTFPYDLFFKSDGTKMYVLGNTGDDINEYILSTAWDISTASYNQNFSVSAQEAAPSGIYFKPDGSGFYICGTSGDRVYQYNLGGFDVSAQDLNPSDLFFKPDGDKMYVVGYSGDSVYEYNLSTEWDTSTASYSQNFSVSAQDGSPQGLSFKDDGTKMYTLGNTNDDVYEYNLSTAWDISTATYSQNFSVSSQETTPCGLFFKPDGTEMYVVGQSNDTVYEYNLSTAWDISTASYASNSFSVASEELVPQAVFFKDDGTKMYISGSIGDDVNEYDLSTAWDVSTASYVQNYNGGAPSYLATAIGIYFKPDGTKLFVLDNTRDVVFSFNIGVQE